MDAVARHVPEDGVSRIIDVGCGTGRFIGGLARRYSAKVYGLDPSRKMLSVACREVREPKAALLQGRAEALPFRAACIDLAFLSMSYHHIAGKDEAAEELRRVLRPQGSVVIRTATRELMDTYLWGRFFPSALELDIARTPSRGEIPNTCARHGLALQGHEVLDHPFAGNLGEYADKIGMRGLSPLRMISDGEFDEGMRALRKHCSAHDSGEPISEKIELFVFGNAGT
jgi:SAM-dependent methyltransferase